MLEAFSYMFKDNKYLNKALIYFIFALLGSFCSIYAQTFSPTCAGGGCPVQTDPQVYLWLILGSIIGIIPLGYQFTCMKALMEQKENYVLPTFNFAKNFWLGFKAYIGSSLMGIIFGLMIIILALIFGIIAGLCGADKATSLGILIVGGIVIAIIALLSILILSILSIAFAWIFANTGWVTSYLRLKRAFLLIKDNPSTYWIAFGFMILIGIFIGILSLVGPVIGSLSGSKIVASLIGAFFIALASSYTAFASSFLVAKAIKPVVTEE